MIKIIHKNLLDSKCDFIVHQVNCQGAMGRGIALQVAKRFPHAASCYKEYVSSAKLHNTPLLGEILPVPISGTKQMLIHLFGQEYYGGGVQTSLSAVRNGLLKVKSMAELYGQSVALPYKMGCGLGGAHWDDVYKIITDVFSNTNIDIEICEYERG